MAMYALTTHFTMPADADWEALREVAKERAMSLYQHVPGLRAKAFVVDPERRLYGGHYVWETREALDAFLASELFQSSVAKFGQPELHRYEVPAYVEQPAVATLSS